MILIASFALASAKKFTFAAMSGRIRGSFVSRAIRAFTVALSRFAVGMIAMTEAGISQSG